MTANHAGGERMAGSHKVRVFKQGSGDRFEMTARPERIFSRVPILGPFFTYNLGRNPKFALDVKRLGYSLSGDEDDLDQEIPPTEGAWEFDLVLVVDGEPMTSEDLLIDQSKKKQRIVTGPWPLRRPGRAELQVGPLQLEYPSLFSFEIKDTTKAAANWIFGLLGVAIGALVTLLAAGD